MAKHKTFRIENPHRKIHVDSMNEMKNFGKWFRYDTWGGALEYSLVMWEDVKEKLPQDKDAKYWIAYRTKFKYGRKKKKRRKWNIVKNVSYETIKNYKDLADDIYEFFWMEEVVPKTPTFYGLAE